MYYCSVKQKFVCVLNFIFTGKYHVEKDVITICKKEKYSFRVKIFEEFGSAWKFLVAH